MQVAAIVKKNSLPKRRIWGNMAVDSEAWDVVMQTIANKRQQSLSVNAPEKC